MSIGLVKRLGRVQYRFWFICHDQF